MRRRTALFMLLAALSLAATIVLFQVLGVVFFALTVALVASPLFDRLEASGVPRPIASALTTALVFVAAGLLILPLVIVLYIRRQMVIDLIEGIPAETTISVAGQTATVDVAGLQDLFVDRLQDTAVGLVGLVPGLALELALFVLVVYGVLLGREDIKRATYAVVPPEYHDVIAALETRAKRTLEAIYVLQAATAAATFVIAVPIFWLLGYDAFITLAVLAGVLQFLPIVGPSLLIGGLAAFHLSQGAVVAALLAVIVGGVLIAWFQDGVIRPRLASSRAKLPGSLYFIGFIGGILSVGAIGVILGPLVVALLAESVDLVSQELRGPVPGE